MQAVHQTVFNQVNERIIVPLPDDVMKQTHLSPITLRIEIKQLVLICLFLKLFMGKTQ